MSKRKYNVIAAGIAFTDVIAEANPAFLRAHGIPLNGGVILDAEKLKAIRDLLENPQIAAGGPSANTVSDIVALGGKAGFLGKVAADETGEFFLGDFRRRGVDLSCDPYDRGGAPSAVCLVLTSEGGNRGFGYNMGCGCNLGSKDFPPSLFEAADFLLIEADLLVSPKARPILAAALTAAKGRMRIVVNMQGAAWQGDSELAQLIADKADIIIGNESEQDVLRQMVSVPTSPQQMIVTTKGERGAELRTAEACYTVPAHPCRIVNGVGAGDGFAAGFLLGLSKGWDIKESLSAGARAASALLEEATARPSRSLGHLMRQAHG